MIRPKIKEICENIDKFKLESSVPSRIVYKNMQIANGHILYIGEVDIDLSREEDNYLKKFAFKKWKTEIEEREKKSENIQNDLLNSINFKESNDKQA